MYLSNVLMHSLLLPTGHLTQEHLGAGAYLRGGGDDERNRNPRRKKKKKRKNNNINNANDNNNKIK